MRLLLSFFSGGLLFVAPAFARDYRFDGNMSEEVLRSYLSRAMTTMYQDARPGLVLTFATVSGCCRKSRACSLSKQIAA
jgi:hypothetical protein